MLLETLSLGLKMLECNSEIHPLLLAKEVGCYVPGGIARQVQVLNPGLLSLRLQRPVNI